jgi:hypothetical protein
MTGSLSILDKMNIYLAIIQISILTGIPHINLHIKATHIITKHNFEGEPKMRPGDQVSGKRECAVIASGS